MSKYDDNEKNNRAYETEKVREPRKTIKELLEMVVCRVDQE